MTLSDEQIDKQWRGVDYTIPYQQFRIDVARAIESAATAPLLTQIAQLEAQLAEARKDAERYRVLRNGSNWPAVFNTSFDPEPLRGDDLDAAMAQERQNTESEQQ